MKFSTLYDFTFSPNEYKLFVGEVCIISSLQIPGIYLCAT